MNKIINNLNKKISSQVFNFKRKTFLQELLGRYGKIIEQDDQITIYVSQRKLRKRKKNYEYILNLCGSGSFEEEFNNALKTLDLNKPVFYIFDNIIFGAPVYLFSLANNVMFKNCIFKHGLQIFSAKTITLENNKYQSWVENFHYGDSFLCGKINELNFINDDFSNSYELKKYGKQRFGLNISANKVNIINSNICAESKGKTKIETKEMNLTNATIIGPEVDLHVDTITSNNSIIKSKNEVIVVNKDGDFKVNVYAPSLVYNGIKLSDPTQVISIDKEKVELQRMRQQLLQRLRSLRDHCMQINKAQIKKVEKELSEQPISQIVKKKTI